MTTFGRGWSLAFVAECATLGVPVEWPLAVFALESGFNPLARNASGARGLFQKMPANGVEYAVTDPIQQMRDAFAFWRAMCGSFHVGEITSREALYCLNLAPARLKGGRYDTETALYEAPSKAYRQNAAPFGLDPNDPVGVIRMRHLAVGLDRYVAKCRPRYDAELDAAEDASARPPRPYAENAQRAAIVTRTRPTR